MTLSQDDIAQQILSLRDRLVILREEAGLSREQLGKILQLPTNTIINIEVPKNPEGSISLYSLLPYIEYFGIDAVLGSNEIIGTKHKWEYQIPANLLMLDAKREQTLSDIERTMLEQLEEIRDGIAIWESTIMDGKSFRTIQSDISENEPTLETIYRKYQSMLTSNSMRLVHVARDTNLENRIKEAYSSYDLRKVLVADVKHEKTKQYYDFNQIRVELVSFLAAQELSHLRSVTRVAIGAGYTIYRMIEQVLINEANHFLRTEWIPLVSFPRTHNAGKATTMPFYTANYLTSALANKYRSTIALWLPYLADDDAYNRSPERDNLVFGNVYTKAKDTSTYMFMSVAGKIQADNRDSERTSADSREYANLEHIFNNSANCVGEINGHFIGNTVFDKDGQRLQVDFADDDTQELARLYASGIPLDALHNKHKMGYSYLVAAGGYKAAAVQACVMAKLANCLIIDSEIAQYLLDNAPQH